MKQIQFFKTLLITFAISLSACIKNDMSLEQKEAIILDKKEKIKQEVIINASILNIRELPTTASKKLGFYKKGDIVEYSNVEKNDVDNSLWLKTEKGYIFAKDTSYISKDDIKLNKKEIEEIKTSITQDNEKIQEINNKNSIEKHKADLLKNSAYYSKDKIKDSLETNLRSPDAPPLYLNPMFAKVTIFPYVTNNGSYHSFEEVWIKIKDGRFILNQRDIKKKKAN